MSRYERQETVALRADAEGVEICVGDLVCGGEPDTDDYDEGTVTSIVDDQVTVAWQSEVATTQHASVLTILRADDA